MRRDSDSLCCQTHGWFTVEHGVDALGREWCDDGTCPECGASPEDPLDPDIVTDDSPLLAEWIRKHKPECQECWALECVEFVIPSNLEAGLEQFRWQCTRCDGLLNDDGERVSQAAGKQVAQ
jgi:hypothetical protein